LGRAVLEIYYNTKNRGKLEREVKKFLWVKVFDGLYKAQKSEVVMVIIQFKLELRFPFAYNTSHSTVL
jgi:hypothetical protein